MRRLLVLLAATTMTFALTGPVLAAPGASGANAVHYYLSLGDSLAAGYQPAPVGDPDDMFRTNQGYTDQLYRMAKAHFPKLRRVKLGCPGETTVSFMQGGEPGCTFEGPNWAGARTSATGHATGVNTDSAAARRSSWTGRARRRGQQRPEAPRARPMRRSVRSR